jgi:hypothetical protein
VLAHAGARPKDRDEVELRIIREVRVRGGHLIDSQDDVGGYPRPKPATRKLTIPTNTRLRSLPPSPSFVSLGRCTLSGRHRCRSASSSQ